MFFSVVIILLSFFITPQPVFAQGVTCAPEECNENDSDGVDYRECQSDTMCCIGGGCPSWVCVNVDGGTWIAVAGEVPYCSYLEEYTYYPSAYYVPTYDCNCVWSNWYCPKDLVRSCSTQWVCPPGKWNRYDKSCYADLVEKEVCGVYYCPVAKVRDWDCDTCGGWVYPTETTGTRPAEKYYADYPEDGCYYCDGWAGITPVIPACDATLWGGFGVCSVACDGGTQSKVNDCGTIQERDCNIQACSTDVDIVGTIWNATDRSCGDVSESFELTEGSNPGDLSGSIGVTADGISGTWNSGFSGYSYEVATVPIGNSKTICANMPDPVNLTNFKYSLSCVNSSDTGVISGSCALVDIDSGTTRFDLGFELTSSGWFTSINGDVFGGCTSCSDSVSAGMPNEAKAIEFSPYLVSGKGTVFGNSNLSVKDTMGDNKMSEDSNRFVKEINSSDDLWWPTSYTFIVPTNAQEITGGDCSGMFSGGLDPAEVYYASSSCVQDGIDNVGGSYSLVEDGIATIYIDDTTPVSFTNNFTSSSSNQRVIFMSSAPIIISSDIGDASPTTSTSPHVQAAIITSETIDFPADGGGAEDTTVIVEGPLVAKDGGISFGRDRLSNNGYPAEVVVYNPIYLSELTKQIRSSDSSNYNGLSVVDITWTINQ